MAWHKIGIKHWRKYLWVFFLWFIFAIGCFIAPFLAFAIPFAYKKSDYIRRFIRAADRLCAAMLGYSGRQMLSTEVAHDKRFKWMYDMLNEIEPNHCEESNYEEGAYCRLKDRTIGYK